MVASNKQTTCGIGRAPNSNPESEHDREDQQARRPTHAHRKPKVDPRQPSHGEIAERAYYLHLEEAGVDELGNWLRAEAELAAA